jgi:hypothetical protein
MALNPTQITTTYLILDIPQSGIAIEIGALSTVYGPTLENTNFAAVITQINDRLTALSATQEAAVVALIARWDALTSTKQISVAKSGTAAGDFANYERERSAIRARMESTIGVKVKSGGFQAENNNGAGNVTR